MKRTTRQWVKKAEGDWGMARTLSRAKDKPFDGVCFHCQQSAEKFLKSLLEELGSHVPRTHNLLDLHHFLGANFAVLGSLQRGLVFLNQFAVDFRYPGKCATKRQATAALRWADRVRTAARSLLGIVAPPRRLTKSPRRKSP
jgi:HEPN domain-containing protein